MASSGEPDQSRVRLDMVGIFERLPEAMVVADSGGAVVVANAAAHALLGYERPLADEALASLVLEEDRERHLARFAACLDGTGERDVSRERMRAVRGDGSSIDVEVAMRGFEAAGGEQVVICSLADCRERLLLEVATGLADVGDYAQTLVRLAELAVPRLADLCLVDVREPDDTVRRMAAVHADPAKAALVAELRYHPPDASSAHPSNEVMRVGRSRWSATMSDDFLRSTTRDERHFQVVKDLGFTSYMSVPLLAGERVLGTITLVSAGSGRRFGERDLALAEQLAGRIAGVVASTRRHDAEHHLVEQIQRLLLPEQLPATDGLDVAVRYVTASPEAAAGGDFYDLVRLSSNRLALLVGDVEGHDAVAAATMGQLRSAVRALAGQVREPNQLIDALRWSWDLLGFSRLVTAFCARIDHRSGEVACASAGHPPPVLLDADGRAELLDLKPASPLGAPATRCTALRLVLEVGQTLFCYTDGLIERRDWPLGEGLASLLSVVEAAAPASADELCDSVFAGMERPGIRRDDVAVLALRRIS